MHTDLATFCLTAQRSLRDAIAQIDRNGLGIVLVVDEERRLLGTVTDGDVRRAILDQIELDQYLEVLLVRKAGTRFANPITAPLVADRSTCLDLLKQHNVLHLPLVDAQGRVAGLITMDDLVSNEILLVQAVVMAGGQGRRLYPLTEEMPKPMLEIGGRPLLEIMIERLKHSGIRQVTLTTHYRSEKIAEHFSDGQHFGVQLSYISEEQPLGTAGGLSLLESPTETILVMNGDILTQVDFRSMLVYHREHGADLTVAVCPHDVAVPYGVVECAGSSVRGVKEKPVLRFLINAGIYLLEPVVYGFIPKGQRMDMTELIERLVAAGRPVVSFPIREYWVDIGQHQDYAQAQASTNRLEEGRA